MSGAKDQVASHPSSIWRDKKFKMVERNCRYEGRNKGKHSGQVTLCNFYFVELQDSISAVAVFN